MSTTVSDGAVDAIDTLPATGAPDYLLALTTGALGGVLLGLGLIMAAYRREPL